MSRLFALLFLLPALALGQSYPSKPIRLVVPFTPAGAVDIATRATANEMTKVLGQPVAVVNCPKGLRTELEDCRHAFDVTRRRTMAEHLAIIQNDSFDWRLHFGRHRLILCISERKRGRRITAGREQSSQVDP